MTGLWLPEAEVVNDVGEVRHGSIQIVVHAVCLDVKVAGDSIDHEIPADLTARVIRAILELPRFLQEKLAVRLYTFLFCFYV